MIMREVDRTCDVAMRGVDNNPARVEASQFFREKGVPAIFGGKLLMPTMDTFSCKTTRPMYRVFVSQTSRTMIAILVVR